LDRHKLLMSNVLLFAFYELECQQVSQLSTECQRKGTEKSAEKST